MTTTTQPNVTRNRCVATGASGKDAYGKQFAWTFRCITPDGKTIIRHLRHKWMGAYMFHCTGKWHVRFSVCRDFAQMEADAINRSTPSSGAFAMTIQDATNI